MTMGSGTLKNISVRDYTINNTINLNTTRGEFQEDNNVLDNPTNTIIIVVYCVLVSVAGRNIVVFFKIILCMWEQGS